MKVKDLLHKIEDAGLYIELIENESGASYGIYKKNDAAIVYTNKKDKKIKKINCQYINGKRLLILYI